MIEFAAQEGFGFDEADLLATTRAPGELSDRTLDAVAGGFNPQPEPPKSLLGQQSQPASNFSCILEQKGIIVR